MNTNNKELMIENADSLAKEIIEQVLANKVYTQTFNQIIQFESRDSFIACFSSHMIRRLTDEQIVTLQQSLLRELKNRLPCMNVLLELSNKLLNENVKLQHNVPPLPLHLNNGNIDIIRWCNERNIDWDARSGTAEVIINLTETESCTLITSTLQMIILHLFNDTPRMSRDDLCAILEVKTSDIDVHLIALVKNSILKIEDQHNAFDDKVPSSKPKIIYVNNLIYALPRNQTLSVLPSITRHSDEELKVLNQRIQDQRVTYLCSLMLNTKPTDQMIREEYIQYISTELQTRYTNGIATFTADVSQINTALDRLCTLGYVTIDSNFVVIDIDQRMTRPVVVQDNVL
jgi:hypothetical protein